MTDDGPVESRTYTLPIIYAVWPYGKPLPNDIECEIGYDIFLPNNKPNDTYSQKHNLSQTALKTLKKEAIQLALGITPMNDIAPITRNSIGRYEGSLFTTDSFLQSYTTPLPNMKIRFQLGSDIWDTYSSEDGSFGITSDVTEIATITLIFQHPKWKITSMNSTTPLSYSMGTVSQYWNNGYFSHAELGYTANDPRNEVLRACDYYYKRSHQIEIVSYPENGIKIEVSKDPGTGGVYGRFTYSTTNSIEAFITIFNGAITSTDLHPKPSPNSLIGTTLHELGHFIFYLKKNANYNNYVNNHLLLRESYASYIGWYLCDSYYNRRGYMKVSDSIDISEHQSRQYWFRGFKSNYSPLFVDLIDDYNQSIARPQTPNENIKDVPHSVLNQMVDTGNSWEDYKIILRQYINTYYTQEEIDNYIFDYDYWFHTWDN